MTEHLSLEVKFDTPGDAGEFTGIASVFGEVDALGDQVAPGAFRKSLAQHKAKGRLPLLLWMHDITAPVGRWLDVRETAEGLAVKGKLILDTARGREAYALLKERALDGLSIGFRTLKSARTKTGRILQEVSLEEISLVTLPALASARVTHVKSTPRRTPALPTEGTTMPIDIAPAPDQPDGEDGFSIDLDKIPDVFKRIEAAEDRSERALTGLDHLEAKIDKIETRLARPSARIEVKEDTDAVEKRAFNAFLRVGMDRLSDHDRRVMESIERKVLTAGGGGSPELGGQMLVPEQFQRELLRVLILASPMRQVARVTQVGGTPVLIPKRTTNLAAAWVAETAQHGVDEPTYVQLSIDVHTARVSVEVSNQLLEDSAFNLEAELARDIAIEFGRLEGLAFVKGSGAGQPKGFLADSNFSVTSIGTQVSADDLIDLYHSVPSFYAQNGTWLMTRAVMGRVRKFKASGAGNFLWADSLQPGNPPTLLGRPIVEMPDLTRAASPAGDFVAFGDWSSGYRIVDRVGLTIQRDPLTRARNDITVFHCRKRTGGLLVDFDAVRGVG
jgi:HK97 family phage major capsid protein/HK97 family phage prohead protease